MIGKQGKTVLVRGESEEGRREKGSLMIWESLIKKMER